MGIGIGIGIRVGKSSGSSNWTPLNPLGGETPNFWYKYGTRNGLILPDSVSPGTGDANILLPYLYKPLDSEYAYVFDNGALDIGNSDLTLFGRINPESATKAGYYTLFGKDVLGFANGCYYFIQNIGDGHLYFAVRSSGSSIFIGTGLDFTTLTWPMLVLQIDTTNKIIKCFVDGVQKGGNQSYTGTFNSLDNKYAFVIGAQNHGDGFGKMNRPCYASFRDVGVLHRLLTPTELNNLNNDIIPDDCAAHWICAGGSEFISNTIGDTCHLKGVNLVNKNNTRFSTSGSQYNLINGYTLYSNGIDDCYVSNKRDGTEIVPSGMPANFERMKFHAGSLIDHNLANSIISFSQNLRDRSDISIYNTLARDTNATYYNSTSATTKKYWHISELNNVMTEVWCNTGYKGYNFINTFGSSYKLITRTKLELFSYATNKTSNDYKKIVEYAGDYVSSGIYENDWIYWKYDDRNINTVRDNKMLKKDGTTVYLSLDGGVTFPYSKVISGLTTIQFSWIFDNGNILFADNLKIYLSTDNLGSINEITAKNPNGTDFIPGVMDNFNEVIPDMYVNISGKGEIRVWPNYSAEVVGVISNVWYTKDSGVTVKSAFQKGITLNPLTFRHCHACNYNPNNGKFYLQTGDGTNENYLIEGTYDWDTDVWTWVALNDGTGYDFKMAGMFFVGNDAIWSADRTDLPTKCGMTKCSVATIANSSNHIILFNTYSMCMDVIYEQTGEVLASVEVPGSYVISSKDHGANFKINKIYFGNTLPTTVTYITIRKPKTSDGWFLNHIFTSAETGHTQQDGGVLWIKIK